jgi:hypothetical protein
VNQNIVTNLSTITVYETFSHPDYTVGTGVSPVHALSSTRGLYRRSGIRSKFNLKHHPAPKVAWRFHSRRSFVQIITYPPERVNIPDLPILALQALTFCGKNTWVQFFITRAHLKEPGTDRSNIFRHAALLVEDS